MVYSNEITFQSLLMESNGKIGEPPKSSPPLLTEEQIIQYEAEKLLREIRAEIKYAESCAEYGDYFTTFAWNSSNENVDAYESANDVFIEDDPVTG